MASSMDELERAAVQLWEAKRLAEYEDVAHGRLARSCWTTQLRPR